MDNIHVPDACLTLPAVQAAFDKAVQNLTGINLIPCSPATGHGSGLPTAPMPSISG